MDRLLPWILGFNEIAKPLPEATRNEEVEPIEWGPEREKAFRILKGALLKAPALGIPYYTKPFKLYCAEMKGVANGVVVQTLGPHERPVAYYSHILDPVIRGTPFCIRAVAAAAELGTLL
uniref:Reverse transcriptase/retrotransposon-derived protein RNase H-like domain-containing protein n=1 Tax=Aquila chrysaetos chrysaetos TaxID=223781 RepID=A0A663FFW8_AQUCH